MDRVPGHAWLMVLAAAVLVFVASAVPLAPADKVGTQVVDQAAQLVAAAYFERRQPLARRRLGCARRHGPAPPALLLSPSAVHPVLDGRLAPRVGAHVPRGAAARSERQGLAHVVWRVPVPRHSERALLRHQRRRLSGAAARPPRVRARPPRGALLVCARADGARRLGRLRAGARPHRGRDGGGRGRPPPPAASGADARGRGGRRVAAPHRRLARLGHPARR